MELSRGARVAVAVQGGVGCARAIVIHPGPTTDGRGAREPPRIANPPPGQQSRGGGAPTAMNQVWGGPACK